jgi:hypothetical protein
LPQSGYVPYRELSINIASFDLNEAKDEWKAPAKPLKD